MPSANKLITCLFYLWRKRDVTIFQQDSVPAHHVHDTIELLDYDAPLQMSQRQTWYGHQPHQT